MSKPLFINQNYARAAGFKLCKLKTPLHSYNMDGTENKWGMIKTYINLDLEINWRKTSTDLLATGLGKEQIILGFPWLYEHNPDINWKLWKILLEGN